MAPTHDQIVSRVTELVAEQLGRPVDDVDRNADLRNLEGADSVKTLRVIAKVEKEFDVMLEDEDVFAVSSITELAKLVEASAKVA